MFGAVLWIGFIKFYSKIFNIKFIRRDGRRKRRKKERKRKRERPQDTKNRDKTGKFIKNAQIIGEREKKKKKKKHANLFD